MKWGLLLVSDEKTEAENKKQPVAQGYTVGSAGNPGSYTLVSLRI